jgi:hypothetical protein
MWALLAKLKPFAKDLDDLAIIERFTLSCKYLFIFISAQVKLVIQV